MTEDTMEPTADAPLHDEPVRRHRSLWQRVVKWLLIAVVALVALVGLLLLGLNTAPGKRFIVDQIEAFEMENGLKIGIGELSGSIYGEMVIDELALADPKGVFATSPRVVVDWRPFAFINGHVDIRALTSPLLTLDRLPELNEVESDPNDPLLPDLDIDVAKLAIDRLVIGEAVSGQKHIATLSGRVAIADARAQVFADAATLQRPGLAGGDKLKLALDAVPDDNKLAIEADISGPTEGLIASLAGFTQPFAMSLRGQGDWDKWDGAAKARLGAQSLADLKLAARDGTFAVRGTAAPGLILPESTAGLFAPELRVEALAKVAERVADVKVALASDAFAMDADGRVDFAESTLRNMLVELRVSEPAVLAPDLVGNNIVAALKIDGAFTKPVVNYQLNAGMIGFGETRLQRFTAAGVADFSGPNILVPVSARVERITGLNEAVGGLLTNVRLDGDIAVQGGRILSDNIRVRSDRLNANAIILADTERGLYTGAIDGRVNDYRVESVGIFNIETDIDLEARADGSYALVGRASLRSTQLFNDGAREFLGGNTVVTTNLSYGSDGVARVTNLRVAAPQFRLTDGRGSYTSEGGISFAASAYSDQYGPLGVRASGTIARPVATLTAARPGLGIGLANLTADIRGTSAGYAVLASGGTDYGPFDADVLIDAGRGPLAIDVNSLLFAGVDFAGRVVQTASGPFSGKLRGSGSGLAGVVNLSNAAGYQRADVTARARGARIPGAYDINIGRAIIDGYAVLYDTPLVVGEAQLGSVTYGDYFINAARAQVDYRGGKGSAKLLAEGDSGVPFRVAANADFNPELWRVALDGRANGIDFKTARPARIVPIRGGYKLLPTRVALDRGSVRLAGRYANTLRLQSRLDNLDLSMINAIYPGYGIGGTANGSVDFSQATPNSFPRADARLNINNFTRTSIAAISTPVDVRFVGRLLAEGGDARALIRRNGTVIGRMVARLSPLAPGAGSWTERLLAAPLGGGIRYNGPAATLFSLAALPEQRMTGDLGLAADFSGRLGTPDLNGVVRGNNLTYINEAFGTRLTNMRVRGEFARDNLRITEMTANAGDGTIQATGRIGLSSELGYPININVIMDDAQLARSDDLSSTASGTIDIINNRQSGALIRGTINLPETRYTVIYQGSSEVAELTGVRRKPPAPTRRRITGDPAPAGDATPSVWKLDLGIKADNRIYISGMGLESEWETDLRITGTTSDPRVSGVVEVIRGTYSFAGRRFTLGDGVIRFSGGAITNPQIDISAEADIEGVTAILNIDGRAQAPQVSFTSNPALPQDEVIARILFGSSVQNLSAIQAVQLASSLNSLRGGGGGLNPLGKLQSAVGFDRLRILGADEGSGRGTALAVGQYLTDDIYLEVITDSKGYTATQLEIALTRSLSILSQAGSFGETNVNVRYTKDY